MSNPSKLYPPSLTIAQMALVKTALQPSSVGSAAYQASTAFATASQGALATTAVQPAALAALAANVKRIDTYTGTTDANGLITVTYPTAFPVLPTLQPEPTSDPSQIWVKVSSTLTGFSMRLVMRSSLTVAGLSLLSYATTNVPNIPSRIVVIAP